MSEYTSLYRLPLLVSGQGQKDITHNEALLLIDLLLHACAESMDVTVPPSSPGIGQCWLVPEDAAGDWTGRENNLVAWTGGGWRYVSPREGMRVFVRDGTGNVQYHSGGWEKPPLDTAPVAPVAAPEGGTTVDVEARQAIATMIARLQDLGLVS